MGQEGGMEGDDEGVEHGMGGKKRTLLQPRQTHLELNGLGEAADLALLAVNLLAGGEGEDLVDRAAEELLVELAHFVGTFSDCTRVIEGD
jgi:hypothetical protein